MKHSLKSRKWFYLCTMTIILFIGMFGTSTYSNAAFQKDKTGNWSCNVMDESAKTVSIKPAKSGVSGVSKGAVTIPNTVTCGGKTYTVAAVAASAYADNKEITSVKTLSGSKLVQINGSAFANCTALTNVAFEESSGIHTIRKAAFQNCTALKKVNLKNSDITNVGEDAFLKVGTSAANIWVKSNSVYTIIKASGKLTANVIAYKYTVTYNGNGANGGKSPASDKFVYTTKKYLADNTFTRSGYHFVSWNTKKDGTGTSYSKAQLVEGITKTGAITLYAIWQANQYTVKFTADSGCQGKMDDIILTYDKISNLPTCKFTKKGYTFKDWKTNITGKGPYTNGASVKNLSTGQTVTLQVEWQPISYTLILNGNGGCFDDSKAEKTYNMKYDEAIYTKYPKKKGYYLQGWSLKPDSSSIDYERGKGLSNLTTSKNAVIRLYAVWEPISYTFIFTHSFSDEQGTMANFTWKHDEKAYLPLNQFTRPGYLFQEWKAVTASGNYNYPDGAEVKNLDENIADNVIGRVFHVYPVWKPITYSLTLDCNGGSFDSDTTERNYDMTYGTPLKLSELPHRKGYTFIGWSRKPDSLVDDVPYDVKTGLKNLTTVNNGKVKLYAVWEPLRCKLHYFPYEGYGTEDDPKLDIMGTLPVQTVVYGASSKIYKCVYRREGYTFAGWKIKDVKDIILDDCADIGDYISDKPDLNLYATWSPVHYKISFNIYGSGGNIQGKAPNPVDCTYDSAYTIPSYDVNQFSRNGYIFSGWTIADTSDVNTDIKDTVFQAGASYTQNLASKEGKEIVLIPKWTAFRYQINYVTDAGTSSVSFLYGEQINIREPEQKECKTGYDFIKWNTKADGSGKDIFAGDLIDKDNLNELLKYAGTKNGCVTIALYPRWTPKTYSVSLLFNDDVEEHTQVITVVYGDTYHALPSPTRVGYSFVGWSTDAHTWKACKKTDRVAIDKNVTLYGFWKKNTYIVTYNANKGTIRGKTALKKSYQYRASMDSAFSNGKLPTPKRLGYQFVKWTYKKGNRTYTATQGTEITDNLILKAVWKKVKAYKVTTYKTTFKKFEGEKNKNKYKVTLKWKCKKADGYEYRCAETKKKLKNAKIHDMGKAGQKVLPAVKKSTYRLYQIRSYRIDSTGAKVYSKWVTIYDAGADKISITFDAKGGKIGENITKKLRSVKGHAISTAFRNGKLSSLKPEKNGYTFKYWYYIDHSGRKIKVKNNTKFNKNITLYAKWEK